MCPGLSPCWARRCLKQPPQPVSASGPMQTQHILLAHTSVTRPPSATPETALVGHQINCNELSGTLWPCLLHLQTHSQERGADSFLSASTVLSSSSSFCPFQNIVESSVCLSNQKEVCLQMSLERGQQRMSWARAAVTNISIFAGFKFTECCRHIILVGPHTHLRRKGKSFDDKVALPPAFCRRRTQTQKTARSPVQGHTTHKWHRLGLNPGHWTARIYKETSQS